MNTWTVKLDYSFLGKLQSLAENGLFAIGNVIYEDKVTVYLHMEPEKQQEVTDILSNLTGGQFTELGLRQELVKT